MKTNHPGPTQTLTLSASVMCLAGLIVQAAPEPYGVDADTLHLWHFDEVQNSKVARTAGQFLLAPPQPDIALIAVNQGTGQVTLVWTSQAGRSYTFSQSTNLAAANAGFARVVTGIPGSASTTITSVAISGALVGFYRVEVE